MLNDFHVFHPDQNLWSKPITTGILPGIRAGHTMTAVGAKLLIFGGGDGNQYLNDLHILDTETMAWTQAYVAGTSPASRSRHTACLVGVSKLLIFGGGDDGRVYNDCYILDVETMSWSRPSTKGTAPSARWGHSMTVIGDGKLAIFGGHDGTKMLSDIHVLDTSTWTWTQPHQKSDSVPMPTPRAGHTMNYMEKEKRLILFGGGDGSKILNDLWALDTFSFNWIKLNVPLTNSTPSCRLAHTSTVIDGKIVIFGGGDGARRFKDLFILDTSVGLPKEEELQQQQPQQQQHSPPSHIQSNNNNVNSSENNNNHNNHNNNNGNSNTSQLSIIHNLSGNHSNGLSNNNSNNSNPQILQNGQNVSTHQQPQQQQGQSHVNNSSEHQQPQQTQQQQTQQTQQTQSQNSNTTNNTNTNQKQQKQQNGQKNQKINETTPKPKPTDPTKDLLTFLQNLGMKKYVDKFISEDIEIDVLPFLTELHLQALGVAPLGARLKLLNAIKHTWPSPLEKFLKQQEKFQNRLKEVLDKMNELLNNINTNGIVTTSPPTTMNSTPTPQITTNNQNNINTSPPNTMNTTISIAQPTPSLMVPHVTTTTTNNTTTIHPQSTNRAPSRDISRTSSRSSSPNPPERLNNSGHILTNHLSVPDEFQIQTAVSSIAPSAAQPLSPQGTSFVSPVFVIPQSSQTHQLSYPPHQLIAAQLQQQQHQLQLQLQQQQAQLAQLQQQAQQQNQQQHSQQNQNQQRRKQRTSPKPAENGTNNNGNGNNNTRERANSNSNPNNIQQNNGGIVSVVAANGFLSSGSNNNTRERANSNGHTKEKETQTQRGGVEKEKEIIIMNGHGKENGVSSSNSTSGANSLNTSGNTFNVDESEMEERSGRT